MKNAPKRLRKTVNGNHNDRGHTICPLYSIQPTMHCTIVSILRLSPSHLQQPVCSLNWLILVVSHHLKQVKSILSGCVQSMTYVLLMLTNCRDMYTHVNTGNCQNKGNANIKCLTVFLSRFCAFFTSSLTCAK